MQPSAVCLPHSHTALWAESLKAHWFYCIWNKIWNRAASHRTLSHGKWISGVHSSLKLKLHCNCITTVPIFVFFLLEPFVWSCCIMHWLWHLTKRNQTDPWRSQYLINPAIRDVGLVGCEENERGTVCPSVCLSSWSQGVATDNQDMWTKKIKNLVVFF